jgi:hypothetical protein
MSPIGVRAHGFIVDAKLPVAASQVSQAGGNVNMVVLVAVLGIENYIFSGILGGYSSRQKRQRHDQENRKSSF